MSQDLPYLILSLDLSDVTTHGYNGSGSNDSYKVF